MRFAHTIVSPHRFRDPAHNPARLALLRELLARLAADRVRLAAIPAGFLTLDSDEAVMDAVADIAAAVGASGVSVIGGVDVEHPKRGKGSEDMKRLVQTRRVPYFGFALRPGDDPASVPLWRQASTTNRKGNANLAPDEALPDRSRLVQFGGRSVFPLLCGEVFNWRIRERATELAPQVVIDLGHVSMGTGLIPAMRNIATGGARSVAHTQHVWKGELHFVSADGE